MSRKVQQAAEIATLFADVFPQLARQIFLDLRQLKRLDLAVQINSHEIVDRCRCGGEFWGTFDTMVESERRPYRGSAGALFLMCGLC